MRNTILIIITIIFPCLLSAQQLGQFDQFTKNIFIQNPAFTGMENYTEVNGNFRRQWAGFDNAPRSFVLSANTRLTTDQIIKKQAPPSIYISDNSLYDQLGEIKEQRMPTPHALGGYVISDRNGPFERMSAFVNYAYHLQVNDKHTLAFGVGAGYSRREVDFNSLRVVSSTDNTFNNFLSSESSTNYFDLKAGLTYYGERFFIGYGGNQLAQNRVYDEVTGVEGELEIHHNLSAGYIIDLNESLELYPTILVRMVDPAPVMYDGALRLRVDQKFWFGAGYRHNEALSAQFGLTLGNKLNLGYSYAVSTTEIQNSNSGSHEISLGIMFNNGGTAPTKMW